MSETSFYELATADEALAEARELCFVQPPPLDELVGFTLEVGHVRGRGRTHRHPARVWVAPWCGIVSERRSSRRHPNDANAFVDARVREIREGFTVTEGGNRDNEVSRWFREASVGEVAAILPFDLQMGLAHLLTTGMQLIGGAEEIVAVRFTVAELDGHYPCHFHGQIERGDVQKHLDLFRENVENFHCGSAGLLRVVDNGKA